MKEKEGRKTVARVEVFNFSEKSTPVRVQVINGEPWFVAKDIAEALGYSNPRKAINDHCKEKGVTFRDSLTEGGVQKLKYINEVLARKIWLYGAIQPGCERPYGHRLRPGRNGRKRRQIYRENEVFLKKKCAGEYTVLKFICMFAVLSFIEPRGQ